jgi:hypothetical protein
LCSCFGQFDTLDVTVQEEFEKYLQERGINESLAIFIPEYAEHKEQKACTLASTSLLNYQLIDCCPFRNTSGG